MHVSKIKYFEILVDSPERTWRKAVILDFLLYFQKCNNSLLRNNLVAEHIAVAGSPYHKTVQSDHGSM